MKKKSLILVLVCMLITALCACGGGGGDDGSAGSNEKVVWKYAHTGRNGDELDQYANAFKKYVEEEFDNVTVELYGADQLGNENQRMEQVQGGSCEFAQVYSLALATIVPEAQAFTINYALPTDPDKLAKVFREGEAVKYINDKVEEKGMKILDWYAEDFSCYTSNKDISSLDKFKGQNIRCMDNFVDIANVEATGANATTLDYSEVYSGLQLGTVDGQQNPIAIIESNKFYEVQKYLVLSNHECVQDVVITNTEFYNSLSAEDQEKLARVFEKVSENAANVKAETTANALQKIKDSSDIKIIELTDEERAAWADKISEGPRKAFVKQIGKSAEKVLELLDKDIAAAGK